MADTTDYAVICRHCQKPEWWGEMHWLSGHAYCRECYKHAYEAYFKQPYTWSDLDGPRPTAEESKDASIY